MLTVYKYMLRETHDVQVVELCEGCEILTVQLQNGIPCLWALVDTERPVEQIKVQVVGTGFMVPEGSAWISTVQDGPYVWHWFVINEYED